jgi:hypothetical protein
MSESAGEPAAPRLLRFAVWCAALGALAILAVLVGVVYIDREDRAATGCGFTPPGREDLPGSGWHVDWEWWPPGFVCVFTEDGKVVARRRP